MKLFSVFLKSIIVLFLLLVFISVIIIVPKAVQNYKGYCRLENRYLTDNEKIRNVIEDVNSPSGVKFTYMQREKGRYLPEKYIPYSSVDEFLEKNKNCCLVTGKGDQDLVFPVTFWGRIWGSHSANVKVTFIATYKDTKGKIITDKITTARQVGNCGKVER